MKHRIRSLSITLLGLLAASAAWFLPSSAIIDGLSYDLLLGMAPLSRQENGVIVIGIDDESLDRYREPLVMWHRQLAGTITAATSGGAAGIGLDLIPTLAMERIAPGLDVALMQAIRSAARQGTEVFLGFSAGRHGTMPEKKFAMTASGLGYLNLFPDRDGTVRRQTVSISGPQGKTALSLAMLLAQETGTLAPGTYNGTYVDYRRPPMATVSLARVLEFAEKKDTPALRRLFSGKIVLVGVTSPRLPDMHRVPATLSLGEHGFLSGVHIHAYMIESIRHGRLRRDAPTPVDLLLLLVTGAAACTLVLRREPRKAMLALAGLALLLALGIFLGFTSGLVLSTSAALCGILLPSTTGLFFRLAHQHQFADTLSRYFRTYVNLDRLEEIMANPRARLQHERELRQSIARGEQHLCYQPKVEAVNGLIAGMEALVRWRKASGEFVSPGHFVPLAEETGLVGALTELIVGRACQFARLLAENAPGGRSAAPKISVNLSARDLERPDLVGFLLTAAGNHGIEPRQLDLEITESALIHDMKTAIDKISALREAGFSISIDDFGTGHSSLGYITRIPFDYLKIDKSLIDTIATDNRARAVVSAIVAMAGSLGAKVVAEGVEDADQLQILRELGCDQIQGYVFSRPLEEQQMLELVASAKVFGTDRA